MGIIKFVVTVVPFCRLLLQHTEILDTVKACCNEIVAHNIEIYFKSVKRLADKALNGALFIPV